MLKKMEILLTDKVNRVEGNVVSDMNGEKVMLSIKNGKYYNLGVVGGDIWDELESPLEVGILVETLLSRYAIAKEECERQVISFLNQLLDEELININ